MILLTSMSHHRMAIWAYGLGVPCLMLGQQLASAAPQGGQVNSGEAVISQSVVAGQSVTTITQSTAKASLNWQSFNIGIGESVRFVQPSASSVTVNRINDLNGSKILGKLSANGQVWLINPAGVYFGPGAQVNVGGLIAASVNLPDHTDPLQLRGPLAATDSTALVINEGRINTSEGGYAALLGANVSNLGNISSPGGRILLLGDKQSGTVYLDGRLDTYSLTSSGIGFIETSAARVQIAENANVSTRNADGGSGLWLIDPTNFTISSGSGAADTSSIGASTLSTILGSSHVSISTDNTGGSDSGNILVNSAVSWSAATQLTLSAYKDIYINAPITSSHSSGKLSLLYGQGSTSGTISGTASDYHVNAPVSLAAGANFFSQLGSNAANLKSYQVITSLGSKGSTTSSDLQGMNGDLTANYALGADIDASNTTTWSTNASNKGFTKIGNNTTTADYYSGTFAGLGHVISDLYLYKPLVGVSGLFSVLSSDGVVRDTGLVNMAITTNSSGGLVGRNYGTVKNSFTTGSITSQAGFVGGLVGENSNDSVLGTGSITNSYSTATVTASTGIPTGGLVGYNRGSIANSYASGAVSGTSGYTGGLVGELTDPGSITNSVWNTGTSGQTSGYGSLSTGSGTVTGLSTSAMTLSGNYSNWNFSTPWIIYSGYTAPLLRAFMTPLSISASASGTQVYDGTTTTTLASYTDPGTLSKTFSGSISFALDSANVGSRTVVASGFYSDQLGYQISYAFTTNSVTVISQSSAGTQTASLNTLLNSSRALSNETGSSAIFLSSTTTDNAEPNPSAATDTNSPSTLAASEMSSSSTHATETSATQTDEENQPIATPAASSNHAVTAYKQNNSVVPGIADLETSRNLTLVKTGQQTSFSADLTWDNHGSEYTGSQRLQAHPQFQHVFTPGDDIELHMLGTLDDMKFGRISYERHFIDSAWRIGATTSRLSYSLGGSAASLQAYGNASQRSLWVDHSLMQTERMQVGWRTELERSDLNDLQDATGISNQRTLNMLHTRLTARMQGDNFARFQSWFSLGVSAGELWIRDTTADLGDATYANTQGRFHKFQLSAGHVQSLSPHVFASLSLQGQWSDANLDASQKMSFGGAQNVRAYRPGVLSGDNGQWMRMEITRQFMVEPTVNQFQGLIAASLFLESAWLQVYRKPWSSITDNQAKLSGAGTSLSWHGPNHWSVNLSVSRALGKTPSLLSDSSPRHNGVWLDIVRKLN